MEVFRKMVGATDPGKGARGGVRGDFGTEVQDGVGHGADSPGRGIGVFFPGLG